MSEDVDIAILVAQMSDEELERAYKELALDIAHWYKKNKKRHAQLLIWRSFIVKEIWHRNHYQSIQDFCNKWKIKEEEYNGDINRLYRENMVEMFNDICSMMEVTYGFKEIDE